MRQIKFHKYHGTGNDFIMIDDRPASFCIEDSALIAAMCHRRFGIGADGLILLRDHEEYDFEMIYFNSDGSQSSMCGNGGRCIIQFANALDVIAEHCKFLAIDGLHEGEVQTDGQISLKMSDVDRITQVDQSAWQLNTGSPHYVKMMVTLEGLDVHKIGSSIRYSPMYQEDGINVNFVTQSNEGLAVLTYERGVEDETYSCGTGVTASALVAHHIDPQVAIPVKIEVKGGHLQVRFEFVDGKYHNIWLEGPAVKAYEGSWTTLKQ